MTTFQIDSAAQDLLFREARTANTFSDEPVTDHQIRAIYDLVKYAPTSINMQPLRLVVVRSDNARERLVKHMSEVNRDKTASAPAVVILAADIDFHEHLPTVFPHAPQMKDMFAEQTSRAVTARFNSTLQIGYFLIGVRAAGLAAGPMTGFDAEGLDADFFPDGRFKSLVVLNFGRPGENAWRDRLPRLSFDEVVTSL